MSDRDRGTGLATVPGETQLASRPVGSAPRVLTQAETAHAKERIDRLLGEMGRAILGQRELLELVAISLLARGHLLLEGLPGLGKTELIKSLSKLLGLSFRRV